MNKTLVYGIFWTVLFCGIGVAGWGQVNTADSAQDTFALRDKFKVRQALYERHAEAFPPPRRNKWSVGVQKGLSFVSGDVRSERGLGIGINVRKALGHLVSLRGQISTGYASGQNWQPAGGFLNNEGLNGTNNSDANYGNSSYPFVFYNYRMRYWDFGFHGVLNLGNISFSQREPMVSAYFFGGPGLMLYGTYLDALDEDGALYDYSGVPTDDSFSNRQDILNALRNVQDGDYETEAEYFTSKPRFANRTVLPTIQFGAGIAFKMSEAVDISLEHRMTFTNDDLLDGQRWEETLTPSSRTDFHHFSTFGINFRFGKNREEALWWSNPLKTPMNDIRNLKRINSGDLEDADDDGVPDLQDLEPETPRGVVVDVKGRALDSDQDGVPDYIDKEPFSPKGNKTDEGGMATDRDRDGVVDVYDQEPDTREGAQVDPKGVEIRGTGGAGLSLDNPLPMIHFDLGRSDVKQDFYPDLLRVSRLLKANPDVRMVIVGHTDAVGSEAANMDLSRRRAEEVRRILLGTFGVDEGRLGIEFRGSDELLVTNPSGAEKQKLNYLNRRVEFVVMEAGAALPQGAAAEMEEDIDDDDSTEGGSETTQETEEETTEAED